MKTYQAYCGYTIIALLVFSLVVLSIFAAVSIFEPTFVELEKIGLKGVVESIWCGTNGCE